MNAARDASALYTRPLGVGVLFQANDGRWSVHGPFPDVDAAAAWARAEGMNGRIVTMYPPTAADVSRAAP